MLIAGPHFGVPSNVREEIERIRSDSQKLLTQQAWEIRRKLEREDVKQAQLSAIARYDVILDASPWRAFARWHSLGFHDAERGTPGDDAPIGFAMFSAPEVEGAPVLSRMEALRERWPWLFVRLSELAPQGLAMAGFSGEEALEWSRQLTSLWPEVPVLAEDEVAGALHGKHVHAAGERLDAPLREPTLRDYLRALKVVAGQVRLVGEDHERPIEDVFVDMELVRRDGLEVKPERQERKREAEPGSERPDAGELEDELFTRWDARSGTQTFFRAGQLLEVGSRILLWGGAGLGKSTVLRWLACKTVGSERVPLWIVRLPVPEEDLSDQLARLALESVGLPNAPSPARRQLAEGIASGQVHLFLDALDEAPPAARVSLVSRVAELGAGVRALISSRPVHASQREMGFVPVELRGLVAGGGRAFLERYYGHALEARTLLLELRSLTEGERWMKTPALLSLAASLYRQNRRLPDATLDLYRDVVEVLLAQTAIRWGLRGEGALRQLTQERQRVIALARGMLLSEDEEAKLAIPMASCRSMEVCRARLTRTLERLATEIATPGTELHQLVTRSTPR